MSYSVMLNSNSNDALNLTKTRDLLFNLVLGFLKCKYSMSEVALDVVDVGKVTLVCELIFSVF